jgi:predicted dehydrogenase
MDGVRVVGITSRTISKAKKLANTSQIEQVYDTVDHLLKGCAPDGIMLLVSANQIYDVAVNLIPAGIPLFLEKPPGLLPEQTKTLTGLANKHGTKNMVGFNRRYYSIFHKGLEIINQNGGLLGLAVEGHERFWKIAERDIPDEIRQNWIYCNSTHTIDLLRLFGGEVEQINALKNSVKEKTGDQFVASMEFESGALGSYTSHWFSPGGWSVTLYGEGVTVKFKPLEKGIWIDTDFQQHDIMPDEVDIKYKQGFYKQMEAFVNMVRTGMLETPAMDLAEALKTMELAKEFAHA